MDGYESLNHTKWECKYHVVFIPKCRKKSLYGQLRKNLGEVSHQLALQKECRIEEGHMIADHVHIMISIPPKYAVSQVVGYIKGKSAIHVARVYGEKKRNFVGQHFWARGYFVSTVGRGSVFISLPGRYVPPLTVLGNHDRGNYFHYFLYTINSLMDKAKALHSRRIQGFSMVWLSGPCCSTGFLPWLCPI